MAKRRDSEAFDDGELEYGWAGGIEIDDQRPSTGLRPDAGARKWVLLGLGTSGLVVAAFVLLATQNVAPAPAAAIETSEPSSEPVPAPSEAAPAPSEPMASLGTPGRAPARVSGSPNVRPRAVESSQPSSAVESTLAAGSSAAVQATTPKPAITPKPAATPKPVAVEVAEQPNPSADREVPQPSAAALPDEASPPTSSAELPDVEAWDLADDEAVSADPS